MKMENLTRVRWLVGVLGTVLALSACETARKGQEKALKAKPAADSGFVENSDQMKKDEDRPVDRIWYAQADYLDRFTSIYIAPVNTDYLQAMDWWDAASAANLGTNREKDVAAIARYFRNAVEKAFREDPKKRLKVFDEPSDDTLVLELAIIEMVPSKVWLNTVTQLFIGAWNHGAAAMEGRVRDGKTGDIIAAFADRQHGDTAIISADDYSWYAHAHEVMDDWANDMVRSANATREERVLHSLQFDATPW
jgi:hypothetical protein